MLKNSIRLLRRKKKKQPLLDFRNMPSQSSKDTSNSWRSWMLRLPQTCESQGHSDYLSHAKVMDEQRLPQTCEGRRVAVMGEIHKLIIDLCSCHKGGYQNDVEQHKSSLIELSFLRLRRTGPSEIRSIRSKDGLNNVPSNASLKNQNHEQKVPKTSCNGWSGWRVSHTEAPLSCHSL